LTVVLSIAVAAAASPPSAGETVMVDGVPHVQNGDTPRDGRQTLTLEEVWRVGGDDDEGLLLAMVTEVCGDEDGNVYVLDPRLCQVHVFSPEGELLRTVFHEGEGPGETLRPRDLVVTADGIGVAEEFPGKIIMVDREGLPMSNFRPASKDEAGGNMGALAGVDFGGGNLVLAGVEIRRRETQTVQDRVNFLASFSESGEETARYCESQTTYDFANFRFSEREHTPTFWWGFDVDEDGKVYVAPDRDAYAISVFRPDGSLERVIEREYEPYMRTEKEKNGLYNIFNSAVRELPIEVKIEVEDSAPAIDYFHRGLRVDGDGNLWVTSSRGLRDHAGGAMLTYDVFDPEGNFVRQVAVECEGDSYYDVMFWISNDEVVQVTNAMAALAAQFGSGATVDAEDEEAEPQAVICYRVKKAGL
jgi:hypothetical protein